jgi:hypothetical protein
MIDPILRLVAAILPLLAGVVVALAVGPGVPPPKGPPRILVCETATVEQLDESP